MFDRYLIGEDGFRNVEQDGKVVGFQFQVRITYYRGLRLSMVEGFEVSVDGRSFPLERNLFTVNGHTFNYEQMKTEYKERWEMGDFAQVTVPVPGGLAPGQHDLKVTEYLRVSYSPVRSVGNDEKVLSVGG